MLPTVAEIVALDAVRSGRPVVLASADRLSAPVRWVHVSELADIAHLLRGGELVLTTGIALPDGADGLRQYVADLAGVGASGLVVELGRRFTGELPRALVAAAERHGLPLVALHRETPFVRITEAVHARIIDSHMAELRASTRAHQVFTELSVEGAEPDQVLRQLALMAGRPVVLENLAHQVLACEAAGADPETFLDGWEARSRAVRSEARTAYDEPSGWLITVVGARGNDWGRLILLLDGPPAPRHEVLVEQAATTLALGRLAERQQESLMRQAHHAILTGILTHAYGDPDEAAHRARAAGVPLSGRRLVALALLPDSAQPDQARLAEFTELAAQACREAGLPALVAGLDDACTGVLLALPARARVEATLGDLVDRLRRAGGGDVVVAAGSVVGSVREARRSLLEARQVAEMAQRQPSGAPFHRLTDMRLRGLLHLLREDSRVQTFVERELGDLLAYDARQGGDLTDVLRAYLDCGRNKSTTATLTHLSRPALYDRLRRIERVLGTDIDSAESCLSLHVALLALDSVRDRQASGTPPSATSRPPW